MNSGIESVTTSRTRELLGHRPFLLFLLGRAFSSFSYQIGAVAIGWQVYALTHSVLALGLIGLVQFLPSAGLTFFAGHAADRFDRRRVTQACQAIEGTVALFLAWGSLGGWLNVAEIFGAVVVMGAARSFESPAVSALLPAVVPSGLLQKATAMSSSAFQAATILGPALGGLIYALSPAAPYAVMAAAWVVSAAMAGALHVERPVVPKEPPTLQALFAGVGFVRRSQEILGTISLDLFAVVLGGATALLPVYAHDILHTGPWGLGILRGAPAVGALLVSAWMTHSPIASRVGMRMFQAVILYGLATIVFGLSHFMWLSVAALFVMGAADMVSVVIRLSLVQLRTPDDMRGRVGAVNFLFINASNQLGEFESGFTAALFGTVPAVVLGGLGTVAVALLWMRLFPALRDVERLEA
ncbi:MAG: MFS transporter [Acidocella sp.]|nr:MFS transporter [Acidocella sp.]